MKIGIYCRISKIKEGNDLSIQDQKLRGIAKAKELSLDYEIYTDEGLSGALEKIEDRPEFERFIGDVSSGKLSHVFAIDQSRFERNPQMRMIINDLFKKKNITYITAFDGTVDLHDPQQEFFGDLLSVINKFHVTQTKIKVKGVLRNRVNDGKSRGVMPYGYTTDHNGIIIIDADESEIVKRIYTMALDGAGTRTITNIFNDEGIPTRMNIIGTGTMKMTNKYTGVTVHKEKKDIIWSPATIRNILNNTFYKGERNYSGKVYEVTALFDKDYWQQVNDATKEKKSYISNTQVHHFLLKGLLRCGICGANYYGIRKRNKHDNHYVCSSTRVKGGNCGNRRVNIDKLEKIIWDKLFVNGMLLNKMKNEFLSGDIQDKNEITKKEINDINKLNLKLISEKDQAIQLVIKGLIPEADITNILDNLNKQIATNSTILEKLSIDDNTEKNTLSIIDYIANEMLHFKKRKSFDDRRKVINDFIKNIQINYDEELKEFYFKINYKININTDVINMGKTTIPVRPSNQFDPKIVEDIIDIMFPPPHTVKSNI